MKKHFLMLAIASSCLFASQANALAKDEYKAEKDKIQASYKVDKAKCDALKNNAQDVCEKEAKGREKVALAELEQQYQPTDRHARNVQEEKIDATYQVAKEKCDDQKGDAKNLCVKQAKADEAKGKAELKAMKKM